MTMKSMTGAIDLTNPKHALILAALFEAGVFDMRDGKVVLNFHSDRLQNIEVTERRYQHVSLPKPTHVPI